jgi:hypothetical protein
VEDVLQTGGIFASEGRVWFALAELCQKCKMVGMDTKPTQKAIAQRLRAVGAVDKQFAIKRYDGKRSIKRYWGVKTDQ